MKDNVEMNPTLALRIASAYAGSQKKLAEAIGVTSQTVTAWMKAGIINGEYADAISRLTGGAVSSQDLLGETPDLHLMKRVADEASAVVNLDQMIKTLKSDRNTAIHNISKREGITYDKREPKDTDKIFYDELGEIYKAIKEVTRRRNLAMGRLKTAVKHYNHRIGLDGIDIEFTYENDIYAYQGRYEDDRFDDEVPF